MKKKLFFSYFFIFISLLLIMSLSRHSSEKIRGKSVAIVAPIWEKILSLKYFVSHPTQLSPFVCLTAEEEREYLLLENKLLQNEIETLQQQLGEYLLIATQISQINPPAKEEDANSIQLLEKRIHALPARVIFRTFDSWNSSLWINIGESHNQNGHSPLIALNSPVIIGQAIVGLIDYVGENQSRVRLISDSRLTPSVRAARGGKQEALISEQIERLIEQINQRKSLSISAESQKQLISLLKEFQKSLSPIKKTWYLAKGELLGSSSSALLGQEIHLKGTGFNYEFSDEEGESRDLRSGKSSLHPNEKAVPILKVNDILVTTGMDGIFPPGFQVAIVTEIKPLNEGDYFYELEARPVAGPLEELSLVFVLPPINFFQ